jgi:hypothetical protein
MNWPRWITAVSVAVFLRWLAIGHVSMTVAGATITVPALAVAAAIVIAAAAAIVAIVAWRLRAGGATAAAPLLTPPRSGQPDQAQGGAT